MPRTTSVSLGDPFTNFIAEKVVEGRYSSASDVMRAGLRLLEEAKLARLRALIDEGDASGYGEGWDFEAFIAERRISNHAISGKPETGPALGTG